MTSPFLGEFLGTMVLVLLGNGVVAGVVLKRSKAEASGWMVITAGWAFAVMAGVFTAIACGSSDAHLNPAVTLGFAVRAGNFGKVAPYIGAQMLGAVVATLFAALEGDAGCAGKIGVFLYSARDSQLDSEFDQRNYRDFRACFCGGYDFFEERCGGWAR
jgi:hypothetical protein